MRDNSSAEQRPEIMTAWHRAKMNGLDPGMDVRETPILDVDRHSRLSVAADPVLDRLVTDLTGTRFSVLLADHSARIVDRRPSDPRLYDALDAVKAVPGSHYIEEVSGTNSLATAYELRKPIAVVGREHFLEALQVFCCYGAPIIHPVTRRLEGVLDVTGPVDDSSPLLGPFLMRAIRDIESRLLIGSRLSEQHLFAEFQAESARSATAIVVLGENVCLINAAAMEVIGNDDHLTLRAIASTVTTRRPVHRVETFVSGRRFAIDARAVADSRDGVLLVIRPEQNVSRSTSVRGVEQARIALITGEPGTGKSSLATQLAGPSHTVINCVNSSDTQQLSQAMLIAFATADSVVLDNIEALEPQAAALARLHASSGETRVIMTTSAESGPSHDHDALRSLALSRHRLAALRNRGQELPGLVRAILADLHPGNHLRVTPSTHELLGSQQWPGNIAELKDVLVYALRDRTEGDVVPSDLPETHRDLTPSLSPIARAERDAITAAFAASGGNKAAAAAALGISRSTLYQRLRLYRIPG